MGEEKLRVLLVASHPVQYSSHMFRLFAQHPRLDPLVAYCSLQGAEKGVDPDFGVEVKWDIPLLEGYPWVLVPNRSPKPGIQRFLGLFNTPLWGMVRKGGYDAVIVYLGYGYLSAWVIFAAAKLSGVALIFGTDANSFRSPRPRWWKPWLKRLVLPRVFGLADMVISASEATSQFFYSLGIPRERVVLTPFVVDNDWWRREAAKVDRETVRKKWDIPVAKTTFLFCAKLVPWKRPQDVLRAFAQLPSHDSLLILAGDGSLRPALESEAQTLGVGDRVRFLGFVNQPELPALYCAADLLVLSSDYDACPVVVCEAMLCGCPVILSDSIRGRMDLVNDGLTGWIYPCGNVDALAQVMSRAVSSPTRIQEMSAAARRRMETWSPRENVAGTVEAVEQAVALKQKGRRNQVALSNSEK